MNELGLKLPCTSSRKRCWPRRQRQRNAQQGQWRWWGTHCLYTMACPSNFIVHLKLPPPMQGGGTWTMPGRIWRRLGCGEEERKKRGDGKVWLRVVTPNRNSWRKNTDIIFKLYIYTTKIHLSHAEKSILESQKETEGDVFLQNQSSPSQHPSCVPRLTNQFWRVKISPLHPFVDTLSTQEKFHSHHGVSPERTCLFLFA